MRRDPLSTILAGLLLGAAACHASPATGPADSVVGIPEQRLPAAEGWEAHGLLPLGVALTRVAALDLFEDQAAPELVALDQRGRCWILQGEGGTWSGWETVHDRGALLALAQADVDPRYGGTETFVGGSSGNLYAVSDHPHGAVDARLIAHFAGEQILCILAGDLDPFEAGAEMLVFTHPAGAYRLHPTGAHGSWVVQPIDGFESSVRDAVLLPFEVGQLPVFVTASRSGHIELASLTPDGPQRETLFQASAGAARLSLAPEGAGQPGPPGRRGRLLYSCLDDGRILRHERTADRGWRTETIHATGHGPHGPSSLAAGRFDPDPTVETVVVFGDRGEVDLLRRGELGWEASPVFRELSGGTWLARCELDGRNATDEILACDLAGRIVQIGRSVAP